MNAKLLMDSRKFCLLMDDLARTWKDKKAKDEDKEMRLDAVLALVAVKPTQTTYEAQIVAGEDGLKVVPVAKRPYKKRIKAALALTPDEAKSYASLADRLKAEVPNVDERMLRMAKQYILPAVQKGQLKVAVPNDFEGRPLPSSNKTWLKCLASIGIHREEIEWGTSADGLPASASPMSNVRYLKLG